MNEQKIPRMVDRSSLRANQAFIIALLIVAFLIESWFMVALVSLIMLVGTAVPRLSFFKLIYLRWLRPVRFIRSDVIPDNPEPHRFAQGFGGIVLALAVLAFLLGQAVIGWVLVGLVVVLAGLNLFLGFCAGCFLYYQLNRINVPGFERSPIR
jgi:hypothetical protein